MCHISPLPDNILLLTGLMGPLWRFYSTSETSISYLYFSCSCPKYVKFIYTRDPFIIMLDDSLSLFHSHHPDNEPCRSERQFNTCAEEFPTSKYPLGQSGARQELLLISSNLVSYSELNRTLGTRHHVRLEFPRRGDNRNP